MRQGERGIPPLCKDMPRNAPCQKMMFAQNIGRGWDNSRCFLLGLRNRASIPLKVQKFELLVRRNDRRYMVIFDASELIVKRSEVK